MSKGIFKKEYYRVDEVAVFFGVHVKTVYRWIDEEKIKTFRTPSRQIRVLRETLEKLVSDSAKE